MKMTIGNRIKKLRIDKGYSQVDFADKIGVSKQTLYKYENDIITNIPSDKIEVIAEITNVSPSYLMGWDQQSTKTEDLKIFELVQKHFGKDAVKVLQMFIKLNQTGQQKVLEDISDMTELSKYTERKNTSLKNA